MEKSVKLIEGQYRFVKRDITGEGIDKSRSGSASVTSSLLFSAAPPAPVALADATLTQNP